MLDYEKLFDRFQPDFVKMLLNQACIPEGIARRLFYLYSHLRRYIRVADTYGAAVKQTNGIGQGCSLSIVIANLYVTTLSKFLGHRHPMIEMGAFLGDRNFTTDNVDELVRVLLSVQEFDEFAGHSTNLGKSTVFANNQKMRNAIKKRVVKGNKVPM